MEPILRFPEFNNDWKIVKLHELLSFNNGINASKEQYGIGRKFINVLDILNNSFITYNNIIGKVDVPENVELNNKVEYGDMLFLRSSETREDVGIANTYLDNNYALFGGFVIRGKRIKEYSPLFLKETLNKSKTRYEIGAAAGGSTRFNVSQDILKNIKLYLPGLEEQKKISNFIAKLDYQIELAQEKLNLLEQQKRGYMQKIFSKELRFKNEDINEYPEWKDVRLQDVANIKKGEQIKKEYIDKNGKYYHLNGGTTASSRTNQYNTDPFTISISEGGNSCGFIKMNKEYFFSGGHNYTLIDLSVSNFYLYAYLKHHERKIMSLRVGSGLPNIQKKDISNYLIKIPCKEEQQKIGDFFSKIDLLIEKQSDEVELLKERKKGILQKLFV